MSRTELLIQEIKTLSPEELEIVMNEIMQRISDVKRVNDVLESIRGKGAGIWNQDAQDYINEQRADDRF